MSKYNIIYTSPDHEEYLWHGKSLSKFDGGSQETLHFSGKTFAPDQKEEAAIKCKAAAKELFPQDTDPKVKTVEIEVA